jgi:hypothetical protein
MFLVEFPTFYMYGEGFLQTAGTNIADTLPSTTVKVIPKTGYTLLAGDFSAITPLPTGISSVNFVQGTGPNPDDQRSLNCTITLDNPLIMPSNNLDLGICISGEGIFKTWNRVLNLSSDLDPNVTVTQSTGTIDLSGEYGTTQTFVQTINASSGYYMAKQPTVYIGTNLPNNYSTTVQDFFDSKGYRIKVIMTTSYVVDASDSTTDTIKYIVQNIKQMPITSPIRVNAYTYDVRPITQALNVKQMKVYGISGAAFSVDVLDSSLTSVFSYSSTIPNSGIDTFNITFPAITTSSETYTITISGNLNSSFGTPTGQPTSFTQKQYKNIELSFATTSANGFTSTVLRPTSNVLFQAAYNNLSPQSKTLNYELLIENPTGNLSISNDIIAFPDRESFTNVKKTNATESEINIGTCVFNEYYENGVLSTNKVVLLIPYLMIQSGTADVVCSINIDDYLTYN